MVLTAYVWDDVNNVWVIWNAANYDFMVPCVGCGGPTNVEVLSTGQIQIDMPPSIAPYQPFKDFLIKVEAADELGAGNTVDSQFTLQLRDDCADDTLTATGDIVSFTYVMGATAVTTPSTTQVTNSKGAACTFNSALEFYDSGTTTWSAASVGTPPFVTALPGTFDTYLDGIDANSIAYRPSTSITGRIIYNLPDSIMTAAQTTITDTFTITIEDECLNDQLTFAAASTANQGHIIGSTALTGF